MRISAVDRSWMRTTAVVWSILVAVALTEPALASTSSTKPVALPNCTGFPAHTMDRLAHLLPFVFTRGHFAPGLLDTCEWKTRRVSGHYADLLEVSLYMVPRTAFDRGEQTAKRTAGQANRAFSTVSIPERPRLTAQSI